MENEDVVNETAETVEADAKQVFTQLLAVIREQDKRLDLLTARMDRQDEINVMQQQAGKLVGEALQGHQRIIEASQPEAEPLPGTAAHRALKRRRAMSPSPPEVLRANQLRRRAAALGVDVYRIVRWDAAAQRESPGDDYRQREEIVPAAPEIKGA